MTLSSNNIIKKLLLLILITAGLYFAREFLIPVAIGAVIATLFSPFCKWLEKHIPKGLAVFVCLLVVLLLVGGVLTLIYWQVSLIAEDMALVKKEVTQFAADAQQFILDNLGISLERQLQFLKDQQSAVMNTLGLAAGSVFVLMVQFVIVMAYIFLFLYYRIHLRQFFLKLFPQEQRKEIQQVVYSAANVSQQYLLGLIKMIACLWIMYGIGFSIVGVDNAIFFAILCGLLEIVPYVGNITGTTLTVLVAAIHGAGFPVLGGIVLTYGFVQFIQGWVLEPLIVGPQVKINPFATIVALILGELIWGIPGVILAIPLTAMLKIVCDHSEPLKPYGFLIGKVGPDKENRYYAAVKSWVKDKFSK